MLISNKDIVYFMGRFQVRKRT